ncbi:MAG: beta-propeller fold lactonase family protein [Planctomycetota bacterium]
MQRIRALLALSLLSSFFAGCGGGGGGGGGSAGEMVLLEAGNGFGALLPHRVQRLDAQGAPTDEVLAVTSLDDLLANVTSLNPVLAPTPWPSSADLPDGSPGNHFLFARFKQPVDLDSVFLRDAGGEAQLAGTVLAVAVTASGGTQELPGRAFVGGMTVGDSLDSDGLLALEQWVAVKGGQPAAVPHEGGALPGLGFPGTETGFPGAESLVDPRTLVFVADSDGDLTTHETFPVGAEVQLVLSTAVRAVNGNTLEEPARACATVGVDQIPPEVFGSGGTPAIVPGNGDENVDPFTAVQIRFTEPVQPLSVGTLPSEAPSLSSTIQLQFGPTTALTQMPFHAAPVSVYDLAVYELTPAFAFPGTGPAAASCGLFSRVEVIVQSELLEDLSANRNQTPLLTFFETGEGAGLVNAPVAPEAIYVGRAGGQTAISVIDGNGFGFSTGDPFWDPTCAWQEGTSNVRNNPNVLFQADKLIPKLNPGECTFDGGSAGVFTLTKDSNLDDRLVRAPTLSSIGDMMLGHSLDSLFHNGSPFGCQSGAGNACAATGFKRATFTMAGGGSFTLDGFENLMQFAPHPNPPPLVFPPTCVSPFIGGQEPTSVDTIAINGATNLLGPGAVPFGVPELCTPPDGLYSSTALIMPPWGGPSQQDIDASQCPIYTVRQQIGHFLYAVDRAAGEIVVLNSNRMTVLDRIPTPDPTSLAMSPNVRLLAVTNQGSDNVTFINIDPGSPSFHEIVKTVAVGEGPTGIAWEPGNEDILVCNTAGNSVSILSAQTLSVRKTVQAQLAGPLDVAITPRQLGFGFQRGVYFAYILNQNGTVSVFESGPDGVNGWGFDDIIGVLEFQFQGAKAIQPDPRNLNSAFWVVHENQLGADGLPTGLPGGAITNVGITGGLFGLVPLDPGIFADPSIRELEWSVLGSVGSDQLTGIPTDIAFDNWTNFCTFPNYSTNFSAGVPASYNAKGLVFTVPGGGLTQGNLPITMYAAVPVSSEGPGVVDVISLEAGLTRVDTNPFAEGTQSIPAPGAAVVVDYFRQ